MERAHTFLFADLAGFTAMTEAMGDESAAELACEFAEQVELVASDFDAESVKRIGDAVMLRAAEAGPAIGLGLQIANEVGESHYLPDRKSVV